MSFATFAANAVDTQAEDKSQDVLKHAKHDGSCISLIRIVSYSHDGSAAVDPRKA